MIKIAIKSVKYPNAFLRMVLEINLDRLFPIIIPKIVNVENNNKNFQSTLILCKSPINPSNEFIAIMTSDVPTAFFMGKFAHNTKAGT